jgi:hypothetical protein
VNVDDLQMHLSDLAQLLRNGGGRRAADPIAELCQRLQPYRERRIQDLMDMLDKAEEIIRTGAPPPRVTKARKGKTDPQAIQDACDRVLQLYHRAADASTTGEIIESAFAILQQLDPPMKQLEPVAAELHITKKTGRKADLLNAMKNAVMTRRGMHGRVQV